MVSLNKHIQKILNLVESVLQQMFFVCSQTIFFRGKTYFGLGSHALKFLIYPIKNGINLGVFHQVRSSNRRGLEEASSGWLLPQIMIMMEMIMMMMTINCSFNIKCQSEGPGSRF